MSNSMENPSMAANVALSTKRTDYKEFITKLEALKETVLTTKAHGIDKLITFYEEEIEFIDQIC